MAQTTESSGSCLCRRVRYRVRGPLRPVVYCHCSQCRKTSGHFVAATAASSDRLDIDDDGGLCWYRSSDIAERGFCRHCGSSLFWKPEHGAYVAIMAGTLETPTHLRASEHIHTADASDYYVLTDGLPQCRHEHGRLWEEDAE